MTTWNHRVIRSIENGEEFFGIHECFYDEGQTVPHSCTVSPVEVSGEDVRWVIEKMALALDRPALEDRDGKLVEWGPVPPKALLNGDVRDIS